MKKPGLMFFAGAIATASLLAFVVSPKGKVKIGNPKLSKEKEGTVHYGPITITPQKG